MHHGGWEVSISPIAVDPHCLLPDCDRLGSYFSHTLFVTWLQHSDWKWSICDGGHRASVYAFGGPHLWQWLVELIKHHFLLTETHKTCKWFGFGNWISCMHADFWWSCKASWPRWTWARFRWAFTWCLLWRSGIWHWQEGLGSDHVKPHQLLAKKVSLLFVCGWQPSHTLLMQGHALLKVELVEDCASYRAFLICFHLTLEIITKPQVLGIIISMYVGFYII